jgi:hypothetical protein
MDAAPGNLWQYTAHPIAAPGTEPAIIVALHDDIGFWLSIAVDTVAGTPTGTSVTATVHGSGPPDSMIATYGGGAVTRYFRGKFILLTGTGATIELIASGTRTDVTGQVLPATVITGTVPISGNVGAQIIGPIDPMTGGVEVDVVGPLYKPGVVDVHDTGA